MDAVTPVNETAGFLAVIERAAVNPEVDVLKMEKMLDMQERILNKQAEMAFNQAMTRLQPKLPTIIQKGQIKNRETVQSTYAKYEDIDAIIRPLYTEEGFSLSFNTEYLDKGLLVFGTLSHAAGHSRTASIPLPLDMSGNKNAVQAVGSTIKYGERYLVGMLFNLVTKGEDDDARRVDAISIEQAAKIDVLITSTNSNKAKFLELMGYDDVRKIKVADFAKAISALNAKAIDNRRKEAAKVQP